MRSIYIISRRMIFMQDAVQLCEAACSPLLLVRTVLPSSDTHHSFESRRGQRKRMFPFRRFDQKNKQITVDSTAVSVLLSKLLLPDAVEDDSAASNTSCSRRKNRHRSVQLHFSVRVFERRLRHKCTPFYLINCVTTQSTRQTGLDS